jgi:hypothetical protein
MTRHRLPAVSFLFIDSYGGGIDIRNDRYLEGGKGRGGGIYKSLVKVTAEPVWSLRMYPMSIVVVLMAVWALLK